MCNNRPSSNSSSNGNGRDLHRIGNLYFPPVQRAPMQWGSDYVRQHARNLSNKQYREQIILPIKQWIPSTKIPRSAYGRTGVLEHALDPKTSGRGEPEMVAPLPHVAGAGPDKRLGRPVTAARTSGELLHRQRRSCRKTRRVSSRGSGQGPRLWRSIFGVRPPLKEVNSIDDLFCFVDERGWGLEDLSVVTRRGDRAPATDPTRAGDCMVDVSAALHPTVRAVLERAKKGTVPSEHGDGRRIGLAIEGGGMRGCAAAGMVSCLHFLGLADSFDGVYGASAGSLVGAYFVSRQANGTAVYHDVLPTAGKRFIDMAQLPRALGFELPWPGKRSGGNSKGDSSGREQQGRRNPSNSCGSRMEASTESARVIRLDFLLGDVVERLHGLDFSAFYTNDMQQPLHVVASGVSSMGSVSLASRRGHFSTLEELAACIRASMLVPGLAGPPRHVPGDDEANSASRQPPLPPPPRTTVERNQNRSVDTLAGGEVETRPRESWAVGAWRRSPRTRSFWEGRARGGRRYSGDGGRDASAASAPALKRAQEDADVSELLVDAMVFEPLPYRSAVEDGCTDVLVLCTRPKGSQVLGKKPGIYETRVVRRYFERHRGETEAASEISDHVQQLKHLRTYAEDALVLGEGSRTGLPQAVPRGGPGEGREAFVVAVAPEASCEEVSQLEMERKKILQGCRDGFAACYDLFGGGASSPGRDTGSGDGGSHDPYAGARVRPGAEVALEYFPDSILSVSTDLDGAYFQRGHLIGKQRGPHTVLLTSP
ncbi:unnamed protein product [Ascophyllum nodosum]